MIQQKSIRYQAGLEQGTWCRGILQRWGEVFWVKSQRDYGKKVMFWNGGWSYSVLIRSEVSMSSMRSTNSVCVWGGRGGVFMRSYNFVGRGSDVQHKIPPLCGILTSLLLSVHLWKCVRNQFSSVETKGNSYSTPQQFCTFLSTCLLHQLLRDPLFTFVPNCVSASNKFSTVNFKITKLRNCNTFILFSVDVACFEVDVLDGGCWLVAAGAEWGGTL